MADTRTRGLPDYALGATTRSVGQKARPVVEWQDRTLPEESRNLHVIERGPVFSARALMAGRADAAL